jgi:AcrR family transcriptional regulator
MACHVLTSLGPNFSLGSCVINPGIPDCLYGQSFYPIERQVPARHEGVSMSRSKAEPRPGLSRAVQRGGRTAFQEEKRHQTRAAILAAAIRIFSETPYVFATVDDIIRAAEVSRATFYSHFDSKLGLALAVHDELTPAWMAIHDKLATLDSYGPEELASWVQTMADLYARHAHVTALVIQMEVFEPTFRQRLKSDGDRVIERLGSLGIQGFTDACKETEAGFLKHVQAHLILKRLYQVCSELSIHEFLSCSEAKAYVHLMAEELSQFITRQ